MTLQRISPKLFVFYSFCCIGLFSAVFIPPQFSWAEQTPLTQASISERIYYGFPVDRAKVPVVYVYVTKASGNYECTGVILNRNTILTAAHCLTGSPYSALIILKQGQVYKGKSYSIHPSYVPITGYSGSRYDLAFIKLKVKLPSSVKLAQLSSSKLSIKDYIFVVGYGDDQFGGSGYLNGGTMQVYYNDGLTILAFRPAGGANICQGDSGGPAFVQKKKKLYLTGITAYTIGSCEDGESGFTSTLSASAKAFINRAKKAK